MLNKKLKCMLLCRFTKCIGLYRRSHGNWNDVNALFSHFAIVKTKGKVCYLASN